jgi:hypothetical protein
MEKLTFSSATLANIRRLVDLQECDREQIWPDVAQVDLTDRDHIQLEIVQSYLIHEKLHLLNEATLWARAIYPLLLIAEQANVRVWSEVSLNATYSQFEVDGIADGAMGRSVAGRLETPYLVVIETKRGIENQNPLFQLYVQLLAAAKLNWETDREPVQEVFGCYTIADSWTFVRAAVTDIEAERPRLQIESLPEYSEKSEAITIVKLLKGIVARKLGKRDNFV